MIEIDGKILSWPPKKRILTVALQNCEKLAVRHSTENPCYLISWIRLQYFVQGCLRKCIFISNSAQTPWNLHF